MMIYLITYRQVSTNSQSQIKKQEISKVHFGHLNNQYTNVEMYFMRRKIIRSTAAFLIDFTNKLFKKHHDYTEIITTCKMH